jgi:uncharacterized membrane protein
MEGKMPEEKKALGAVDKFFEKAAAKEGGPVRFQSYWTQSTAIIRRRIITGLLFAIPIVTTYWFLDLFLKPIYTRCEPGLRPVLEHWGMDYGTLAYSAVMVLMSVVAVLAILYLLGLVLSRAAIRRLISLAEDLVERIPFVKVFYKTAKQIVEMATLSSKGALKKVILIDFPCPPLKAIAFATGETVVKGSAEPSVIVYVATSPHITAGYMVLLPRSQVWETDLTTEEALKFVISGGILHPDQINFWPYGSPPPTLGAPDARKALTE